MAFWPGSLSYNVKFASSVRQGRSSSLRHADTLDGNETAVEKSGPWANLQAGLIVQVEKPSCECEPVTVDKWGWWARRFFYGLFGFGMQQ